MEYELLPFFHEIELLRFGLLFKSSVIVTAARAAERVFFTVDLKDGNFAFQVALVAAARASEILYVYKLAVDEVIEVEP